MLPQARPPRCLLLLRCLSWAQLTTAALLALPGRQHFRLASSLYGCGGQEPQWATFAAAASQHVSSSGCCRGQPRPPHAVRNSPFALVYDFGSQPHAGARPPSAPPLLAAAPALTPQLRVGPAFHPVHPAPRCASQARPAYLYERRPRRVGPGHPAPGRPEGRVVGPGRRPPPLLPGCCGRWHGSNGCMAGWLLAGGRSMHGGA